MNLTMLMKSSGEISREVSIIKKLNKSLMLLIIVCNMASVFTQMYIAKATSLYILFLICCTQCHLHLFPFFEPIWTFLLLFSFAAVTGPMYSGASAFHFLDENPAINPTAISSKKSR